MDNEATNQAANTTEASAPAPAANNQQAADTQQAAAQNTGYNTLLGGKAGEGTNNSTEAPAQQTAEQVEYNFTETVKGYEQFEFNDQDQAAYLAAIKDMHLSNEQANAMLKYGMDWGNRIIQDVQTELDEMVRGWGETAKKELGSEFDTTLSKAGAALEAVEKTVPGIRQALQDTGAGNRVEIIKALAFFADQIAGDPGMVAGAQGSNPADQFAALYPNTDWSKI